MPVTTTPQRFDPDCRRCPRLAAYRDAVRQEYPHYHCRPVPPFGDPGGLLIVGLAPGLHGANATARPFTGDHAGVMLYETLYRHGFASASRSRHRGDSLRLRGCRVTNAVLCLPPGNKPAGDEVARCRPFLADELGGSRRPQVVLALGRLAHASVVAALGQRQRDRPFGHGRLHELEEGPLLLDSYHCSRYNTRTGRLTPAMFDAVVARAAALVQ